MLKVFFTLQSFIHEKSLVLRVCFLPLHSFTDVGAQRLADMLAFNITLTVVAFGDPIDGAANVTERGEAAFAKALTVRGGGGGGGAIQCAGEEGQNSVE